jgi:hypothetical protein
MPSPAWTIRLRYHAAELRALRRYAKSRNREVAGSKE